jgi:hypothetical protein
MAPIECIREICGSLPDVTETPHFGETMFKSRGRPFVSIGEKDGVTRVVVQLEPEHVEAVLASDAGASLYVRAKNCVALEITETTDWNKLRLLILESHDQATGMIGSPKKPAKARTKGKKAAKKRR